MTGGMIQGVRVLGEGVPYLDGAEDELLKVMRAASDRGADSDELAASIVDWPSRYHLSRLRGNLLLPLKLGDGQRVLDVGCGTGALSRIIAERGCRVTGLEGSLARAMVARERTVELPNCDIVAGSLSEYVEEGHDGEFDVVLLCGVLEYSVSALGGTDGPERMLAEARRLIKPDGVVVIAIENQLGLKYLLGYPEDHRGLPWVGIDGYRSGRNPARTWSRHVLSGMLAESGLTEQQWLYPYPDYKLPMAIVRDQLFRDAEGRQVLGQFVRGPVLDYSGTTMITADATGAFQTLVDADMGAQTANSFLVVAGGQGCDPGGFLRDGDLWMSTNERVAEMMSRRVLRRTDGGWELHELGDRREVHFPPLVSTREEVPVQLGENLEDEIVALASRATRPSDLRPILDEWWTASRQWLRDSGEGCHFDILPRNFIRTDDGGLTFVDREWLWRGDVPDTWPLLRTFWHLVGERLWPAGAMAGLSWGLTLGDATLALASEVRPDVSPADLLEAIDLESQFHTRVSGLDREALAQGLRNRLDTPLLNLSTRPSMAQLIERPVIAEDEARAARMYELSIRDELIGTQAALRASQARLAELQGRFDAIKRQPVVRAARKGLSLAKQLAR